MAINKVDYFGTTLIDITDTTATPETVLQGYDFYDASGQKQTGEAEAGTVLISDTEDEHGGTIRTITIVNYIFDGDNLPYGRDVAIVGTALVDGMVAG